MNFNLNFLLVFLFIFTLSSCGDDDTDVPGIPLGNNCTLPTGYLKWNFDGSAYCANTSLFADHAIIMTINGITQTGVTMTLELDDITPGTYTMNEDTNSILFTDQLAMAWQSTNSNPGTLIITSNDTANNILQATFNPTVRYPLRQTKFISPDQVKIIYTE
ncbi:MAG: hypothetical protein IPM91_13060 [Bacteroidetes bacterium]|nr:hypothetical protein [Bacteroidota bacterium]